MTPRKTKSKSKLEQVPPLSKRLPKRAILSLGLSMPLLTTSCGQNQEMENRKTVVQPGTNNQDANSASQAVVSKPPKAYYDALLVDRLALSDSLSATATQIVYVNFGGAAIEKGFNRGQSFIPCNSSVTVPESGLSVDVQQEILKKTGEYFSNAGAKIALTFDQPTSGDFTTIHVGGTAAILGCVGNDKLEGVAPLDAKNANPNDIGFVFSKTLRGDSDAISKVIARESGRSFGLDYTESKEDLMHVVLSSETKGFGRGYIVQTSTEQDAPQILKSTLGVGQASISGTPVPPTIVVPPSPIPLPKPGPNGLPNLPNISNILNLPGLANLASISKLLQQLPFDLSSLLGGKLPDLNNLPNGVILNNPQDILSVLTVLQQFTSQQNGGAFDISALSGLLQNSQLTPLAQMLLSLGLSGGNPSAVIGQIMPIIIPMITQGGSTPAVPIDLAALLNISQIKDPASLIKLIPTYSHVINGNLSGGDADAMLDLIKMAISSQYLTL